MIRQEHLKKIVDNSSFLTVIEQNSYYKLQGTLGLFEMKRKL